MKPHKQDTKKVTCATVIAKFCVAFFMLLINKRNESMLEIAKKNKKKN